MSIAKFIHRLVFFFINQWYLPQDIFQTVKEHCLHGVAMFRKHNPKSNNYFLIRLTEYWRTVHESSLCYCCCCFTKMKSFFYSKWKHSLPRITVFKTIQFRRNNNIKAYLYITTVGRIFKQFWWLWSIIKDIIRKWSFFLGFQKEEVHLNKWR